MQTSKEFVWCPLVDESLYENEAKRLSEIVGDRFEVMCISIAGDLTPEILRDSIVNSVGLSSGETVTTTRLDNDDALAPDYVRAMRELAASCRERPFILDFPRGLVVDRSYDMVLTRGYFRSPFQTLVESPNLTEEMQTVFKYGHHLLADHFAYRVVDLPVPMWIMNVHGANLANRAWGLPLKQAKLPDNLQPLLPQQAPKLARRVRYVVGMMYRYLRYVKRSGSYKRRLQSALRNLYPGH